VQTEFKISPDSLKNFNETLRKYAEYSSRTLPQIVNEKAFFIARAALRFTHKADIAKIKKELGETGREIIGYRIKSITKKEFRAEQLRRDLNATLRAFGGIRKEA